MNILNNFKQPVQLMLFFGVKVLFDHRFKVEMFLVFACLHVVDVASRIVELAK